MYRKRDLREEIPKKQLSNAVGFDEVAIVPGDFTINPDMVTTSFSIGKHEFEIPILSSAMDAVSSPDFVVQLNKMGGLGVMNLEGIYTRYKDPEIALEEICQAPKEESINTIQRIYASPIDENLIGERISKIKEKNVICAVSVTPANTKRFSAIAVEAGADILVVQSTVSTARHISRSYKGLVFSDLLKEIPIPVIVGNCVTFSAALELLETGIHGILVGVGPGAACTTREVVGVGVPQVTATIETTSARDYFYNSTGKYIPIITDGGIRSGGDFCKAIVSGADAVMLGTPFAQSEEAAGKGFNWGMATSDAALPRGARISVGNIGTLNQILFGPSSHNNGTQNLIGALRTSMGMCGAITLKDMHEAELIIAPSIKTEGKYIKHKI